jgi:sodium transport system permease protein
MSAVFFGITHQILQQSIIATIVGVILGYLAVQTGSIFTGMAYHVVHNAIMLLHVDFFHRFPVLDLLLVRRDATSVEYHPVAVGFAVFLVIMIFVYFARLKPAKSAEEVLQEQIVRQDRPDVPEEDGNVAERSTKAAV